MNPDAMKDLLKTYVSLFQEGAALAESGLAYVPAAAPGALVQQGKEVLDVYVQKMKHDMAMENAQQQGKPQATNQQKPLPIQSGGGSLAPFAGLVTAAVIGGGLFLAASRSYVDGKDDPPPNTGTF